jgi:capsular exopolysaccharide synthesis family protein
MSRVHDALSRAGIPGTASDAGSPTGEQAGVPLFPLEGPDGHGSWSSEGPGRDPETFGEDALSTQAVGREQAATDGDSILDEASPSIAEKLVLSPDTGHDSIEQYRRLAARLHLAQAEHGIKVVMVASALPGEGKTLTATNLALTLSESYQRSVLLIDGDLRRPSMHEMFHISNVSGLNDGVRSDTERKVPLVRWSDHLSLVTAGRPDPDPMRVLVSDKMRKVISEATARFEWVIIDTPPVGLLTDASLFSAMVDTAVLVVQAGRTPHAEIQRAIQAIGRDRIFGVVLNRANARSQKDYAYEYRYTSSVAITR